MSNNILITKAKDQASALSELLHDANYNPFIFPAITIEPINNPSLRASFNQHYDGIIFTSINAVNHSRQYWPNGINSDACYAVGPSTAAALKKFNIEAIVPDNYSSEGLLALEDLQKIKDKRFLIVCGEDPKPLLQKSLEQHGALVKKTLCYKRSLPKINQKIALTKLQTIKWDFIISTSLSCLENLYCLFDHAGQTWLNQQNFIVINKTMLKFLQEKGNQQQHLLAKNATNAAIIKVLLEAK